MKILYRAPISAQTNPEALTIHGHKKFVIRRYMGGASGSMGGGKMHYRQ